jgi:anti-sigma28 factor (negative regulator of flagellin synthesis)
MRVDDKQATKAADSAPPKAGAERTVVRLQGDRVSLDNIKQVQAVVQAVQASMGADRASRLQELETSIRRGGYQPDAGRLAERIVQAAEVDARLRAIFGG